MTPATRTAAVVTLVLFSAAASLRAEPKNPDPLRLPSGVPPVMVTWGWWENEFEPDGYKPFIDAHAEHSGVNYLTTTLRVPLKEVTDADVHEQIERAAAYARQRGMAIVMDLDVRLARNAFRLAYPNELQQMVRLREVALQSRGNVVLKIPSEDLNDHYTFRTVHYIPLSGHLLRVYSYKRGPGGIDPDSVRDLTGRPRVSALRSKDGVSVTIACEGEDEGRTACAIACFTHFYPDVFSPHLDEFQRRILEGYRGGALAGACKDEWGFPPCMDGCPDKNDYWYSRFRAEAYARRTGDRDLLRDFLLMTYGERGRESERQAAINHFMEMSTQRNGAIEDHFYHAVKEVFGPSAVVATHPTWFPYPGRSEFKKNGLHWWIATRDLAQTDEVTPYCARTSLAKKWNSPVWYNMFYAPEYPAYAESVWAHALGGGRISYHPLYPAGSHGQDRDFYESHVGLLRGGLMRGDCRIRLLNFIVKSPLDCPAAVIFGHPCAMNWAGPAYDDVGMEVADGLWRAGYPADLIPSSEIGGEALRVGDDGSIWYGPQRYQAVVLYHPEFERRESAGFWGKAARGKTTLARVGDWTRDFDGRPLDERTSLPASMTALPDGPTALAHVVARLKELGVAPQTPANRKMDMFGGKCFAPPPGGRCRLIDGTEILLSGADEVAGDPIQTTFDVAGTPVAVDAVGVVGVRLSSDGRLDALAAGGLKRIEAADLKIELAERVDVALWRDGQGKWQGVLQGCDGPVPAPLTALTDDWLRLGLPTPLD